MVDRIKILHQMRSRGHCASSFIICGTIMKLHKSLCSLAVLLICLVAGCQDPWQARELVFLPPESNACEQITQPELTESKSNFGSSLASFMRRHFALASAYAAPSATPLQYGSPQPPQTRSPAPQNTESHNTLGGCVALNSASTEQLSTLKGIGPKKALLIVNYRQKRLFKSNRELTKIKGIGQKSFQRLSPQLCPIPQT